MVRRLMKWNLPFGLSSVVTVTEIITTIIIIIVVVIIGHTRLQFYCLLTAAAIISLSSSFSISSLAIWYDFSPMAKRFHSIHSFIQKTVSLSPSLAVFLIYQMGAMSPSLLCLSSIGRHALIVFGLSKIEEPVWRHLSRGAARIGVRGR